MTVLGLSSPTLRSAGHFRALPACQSAHGIAQSWMSPSAADRTGPIELFTSTTSPGREKLKNHAARSVERLMQPWDTLLLPCCPTDHGAPWTNSPLLEMRTAYSTSAR